jgi:hypothetical protein
VITTGGLTVSIVDLPNPLGVTVAVVGPGAGTAEIDTCGTGTLELTAGEVQDIECGSAWVHSKVGPSYFRISTVATEMPSGGIARLSILPGPVISLEVDPASARPVVVGGLTALPGQTVQVVDIDADGMVNQVDDDDDGDLVGDVAEVNCASDPEDVTPPLSRPERIDGPFAGVDDDGDTVVDEGLPGGGSAYDCDGDGFTGAMEAHVYSYLPQASGDQKTCQEYDLAFPNTSPGIRPSKRWPADLNYGGPPTSLNRINLFDLTSLLAPVRYFGTDVGTNPSDVRFDLVPGPGFFPDDININDLTALLAGGTGFPAMLGYGRAFNGAECPFAP